jgi:hypothetical protein
MSDSPRSQTPADGHGQKVFNIIFLAASVYEFNIDRARKEAGYPYLTYVAGEIFDVLGEKRVSFGLPRTRTTRQIKSAGFGVRFAKLAT